MGQVIFRIEHETQLSEGQTLFRCGPYGNGGMQRVAPPSKWGKHPTFQDETGEYPESSWFFGFLDLEQLKRWFTREERRLLKRNGFVCRQYEGLGMSTERQAVLIGQACEVRTLLAKEWV